MGFIKRCPHIQVSKFHCSARSLRVMLQAYLLCVLLLLFWTFFGEQHSDMPRKESCDNAESALPVCEDEYIIPPGYILPGYIGLNYTNVESFEELESDMKSRNISIGGHWRPSHCKARQKIAIVVPMRNREAHLKVFLRHMHPFLQRQNANYRIFVVEQAIGEDFNRGAMINIGFALANGTDNFNCYIFHDIDTLPNNDNMKYFCPDFPYHLSSAIDKYEYGIPYHTYLGGVVAIKRDHFEAVNGFSNLYFGWGAEDDDFWLRIWKRRLAIVRIMGYIFGYKLIPHVLAERGEDRKELLESATERMDHDGLNSLHFAIFEYEERPLFTHIVTQITKTELQGEVDRRIGLIRPRR